jgi:hypothetical protein
VQEFDCVQMSESGCTGHYKFVKVQEQKQKV